MKQLLIIIAAVIYTASPVMGENQSLPPMTIVYYKGALPHSWEDEAGTMRGIFVDLLTEALVNRMNLTVVHKGYPWARAQKMVEDGDADAFCTVPNEHRRSYTYVSSVPTVMAVRTMFAGRDNPVLDEIRTVRTVSQLSRFKVVTYLGSGFAASHPELHCTEVPNSASAIKMIASNRADIFFELDQHGRYISAKLGIADQVVEIPMEEKPVVSFHLCIGKDSPYASLLSRFEIVMTRMFSDGTYERILKQY